MKIKELTWLKILAYPGMLLIFFVIYLFLPYMTWLAMPNDVKETGSMFAVLGTSVIVWYVLAFILGALGIYGLALLVRLLNRVERGETFTMVNATLLEKMDKVVLWGLGVALVLDLWQIVMDFEPELFLLMLLFTLFLLVGHLMLKPLAKVVARAAKLQEDLDLTV